MAFQQGLSGLYVYSKGLDVISNNIANASTVGFKSSTAQFSDVYAGSMGVMSNTQIGIGAKLMAVAQNFGQGNVSTSSNSLDIAINGSGFFRLQMSPNDQSPYYTRNGQFHLNKDGYIVNANGGYLTGYQSNDGDTIDYARIQPLTVGNAGIEPKQTGWSYDLNSDLGGYFLGVNLDNRDKKALSLSPLSPHISAAVNDPAVTDVEGALQAALKAAIPNGMDPADAAVLGNVFDAAASAAVNTPGDDVAKITAALAAANAAAGPTPSPAVQKVLDAATNASKAQNPTVASMVAAGLNAMPNVAASDVSGVVAAVNSAMQGGDLKALQDAVASLTDSSWTGLDPFRWDASFNSNMYNYSTSSTVYDQTGAEHKLTNYFVRAGDTGTDGRTWYVYTVVDDQYLVPHDNSTTAAAPSPDAYAQVLEFEPSGKMKPGIASRFELDLSQCVDKTGNSVDLTSDTSATGGLAYNWFSQSPASATASGQYAFHLDLGDTTMFGVKYSQDSVHQDGYAPGTLTQVTIGEDGMIQATYSNGQVKAMGQLALTEFRNPNGLQSVGDNMWVETSDSGQPTIGVPGSGTRGSTLGGQIEESNTDLTNELVQMIIMQRNYQANAQTIKTEDQILQTLVNLR